MINSKVSLRGKTGEFLVLDKVIMPVKRSIYTGFSGRQVVEMDFSADYYLVSDEENNTHLASPSDVKKIL